MSSSSEVSREIVMVLRRCYARRSLTSVIVSLKVYKKSFTSKLVGN